VAVDEFDDLGRRHVTVGIGSRITIAGQAGLPVRRQEAERVPALVPPRVRDLAALEHDVLDAVRGERAAHREAGMPGTDDDSVDDASHSATAPCAAHHLTSTATLVGFVTMSNTAERRCD